MAFEGVRCDCVPAVSHGQGIAVEMCRSPLSSGVVSALAGIRSDLGKAHSRGLERGPEDGLEKSS